MTGDCGPSDALRHDAPHGNSEHTNANIHDIGGTFFIGATTQNAVCGSLSGDGFGRIGSSQGTRNFPICILVGIDTLSERIAVGRSEKIGTRPASQGADVQGLGFRTPNVGTVRANIGIDALHRGKCIVSAGCGCSGIVAATAAPAARFEKQRGQANGRGLKNSTVCDFHRNP